MSDGEDRPSGHGKSLVIIHPQRLAADGLKALIEQGPSDFGPVRIEPMGDLAGQLDAAGDDLIVCMIASREAGAIVGRFTAAHPERPLVAIVERNDGDLVARLAENGARGIITGATTGAVAVSVLRLVMAGGTYVPQRPLGLSDAAVDAPGAPRRGGEGRGLTRRQSQVLQELGSGLSNRAIAERLGMQESTVKAHVKQIIKRLGVDNRTQAALVAAGRAVATPREE